MINMIEELMIKIACGSVNEQLSSLPYLFHLFNPLPDDEILDWSKLKQIADDILKGRKHCEKRRNCLLQASSPFPTMFSTAIYL